MKKAAGRIVHKLRLHGYEAYFAGGCVRDFLLHRKPKDIDIATNAVPDEVRRLFPRSRAIGAHFGVIQVLMYGVAYEVATFRQDHEYIDGRHPATVTFSTPQADAERRDFTINGLFYDPVKNEVIDFVRGEEDLRKKLIRTIGDPRKRFAEDKLRMLRAIRFSCSLDFPIESGTWGAITDLAGDIAQVSWERIRDEFMQIITGPNPGAGLDLLYNSGLLLHIMPEITALLHEQRAEAGQWERIRLSLSLLKQPSFILAMGALLHFLEASSGSGNISPKTRSEQICRRLKLSNDDARQVVDLATSYALFSEPSQMARSAWMRLLRKPDIGAHLELLRVRLLCNRQSLELYEHWQRKLSEFNEFPEIRPFINGDDLILLGHSPGPLYKEILKTVEDLQLDGALRSRSEALQYIRDHYPLLT